MTVNSGAEAILRGRVVDTQGKNVMVRFPPDLYVKALKKQSRMIDEAADKGETWNISIHSVVLDAVRVFVTD
jgi:hypothetical protein